MSWWSKATEAQKLAQIDGGIECGLSARQIAVASGLNGDNFSEVLALAKASKRTLGRKSGQAGRSTKRTYAVARDRSAYLRGDRVNLWGNDEPQDEFALDPIPAHTEEDAI